MARILLIFFASRSFTDVVHVCWEWAVFLLLLFCLLELLPYLLMFSSRRL